MAVKVKMSSSRKAARDRQIESRTRAIKERKVSAKKAEIVIYVLKNRGTGEVRNLIDARGAVHASGLDWVVRDPETGAERRFKTRKALGAGYAAAKLVKPTA